MSELEDKLKLESWGLPDYILEKYIRKGVECMFPWQVECLTSGNVLTGGNLVYSAPTSAGKTLVAEILTLQTVLERKQKVIIILPFVSVVREKMLYFQELLSGSGIRVEGFMGSYSPPGGFRAVHVAICTIEKANSLINRLLEERSFESIGCVIVDELHLLSDPHRGYLLELLLTKIKYICKTGLTENIQIIGMSATLPNLDLLGTWLDATLYKTEFRPIPLQEYIKVNKKIYKSPDCKLYEEMVPSFSIGKDAGDVIYLCIDTILNGFSALVFCPTKNWCETLAQQVAAEIKKLGTTQNEIGTSLRNQLDSKKISDVLEQLKKCPAGLENSLGRSVSFGVGYHHAGLTMDERDIIEAAFRKNVIRVIIATSTLSSGVNLPARRVIIRSPLFNGRMMDVLTYKQMVGRAGRMGKDTQGESYLICTEEDKFSGLQLASSSLPPVESCLGHGDLSISLRRAILEVVASGVVTKKSQIRTYAGCTLLAQSVGVERLDEVVQSCLSNLQEQGFLVIGDTTDDISASSLAEACFSASIPPDQGVALTGELGRARKCFVLETDLHALYQVIPFSICEHWDVDWIKAFSIWESLPEEIKKIGYLIGVEERFLIKAMRSSINIRDNAKKISVLKRFYTALALQDLVNEQPLYKVAEKYGCNKGMLQSLQQSASTFAGMVTNFCRKLSWGALEVVVAELGRRIQFGVQRDLLDLMRIDCMTSTLARGLFNAGITSLPELAASSLQTVQMAIRKAVPFQNEAMNGEERKDICLPGRPGLSDVESADIFIHEARLFLLREMGVKHAEWTSNLPSIYEQTTIERSKSRLSIGPKILNKSHEMSGKELFETSIESKKPVNFQHLLNISSPLASKVRPEVIVPETQEVEEKVENFTHFSLVFDEPFDEVNVSKKNIQSSTPIGTPEVLHIKTQEDKRWSLGSLGSNNSASDLFAESPVCSKIEEVLKQNVEDIDPNLGGDSILELSILAEEVTSSRKRRLSESLVESSFVEFKKPCLVECKANLTDYFTDNINIDSKLENILGGGSKKDSISNSYLVNAFEDSFGRIEEINSQDVKTEIEQINTPDLIESPNKKIENVPTTTTPRKWKRQSSGKSPSKYASIGVSIIKSSPKNLDEKVPDIDALFKSIKPQLSPKTDANSPSPVDIHLCRDSLALRGFLPVFVPRKEAALYIQTSSNETERRIGAHFLPKDSGEKPQLTFGGHALLNVQLSWDNTTYIFDLKKSNCPCLNVLRAALGMKDKTLWAYNVKEDLKLLYNCTKILVGAQIKDLSIADWLIHPSDNCRPLNQAVPNYLNTSERDNIHSGCTWQVRTIWALRNNIRAKLEENELLDFFNDIEVPLLPCIFHMEIAGLKYDRVESTSLWEKVDSTMKQLEEHIYALAGHRFSITSRKDLNLMKNILKITAANESKSDFMKAIHNWRKLSSLKSRNLSQLLSCLDEDKRCRGVSSSYTSTGRIVMHDPNLQHVPRDFSIEGQHFSPRSSFIPNRGNLFLSADYSQLELRILAHFSQDEVLLALINSEQDVFQSIAANWNNISPNKVTDDIRQETKQIIYGIIYGMGDKTLGEHLNISAAEAGMMAAKFRRSYPGVQAFLKKCIHDCSTNGFILTITGRKRLLPGINSNNRSEKNQAERQAINSTIQGSAADIAKRALVRIEKRLNEILPSRHSSTTNGPSSHLVLHLHDEFLYEVSHDNLAWVKEIVKHEMENATLLSVRLPVVIKVGSSWGSLKKV